MQQVQQQQVESQSQQDLEPQCILTFGLSQHGKSSFINTICRENLCKVGQAGKSCTKEIETYSAKRINGQIFNFIDLPGVVDSDCLYDDEEYKNKMIAQLQYILVSLNIETPNIRGVIIVLSLAGDTCQLTRCIKEIIKFLKNSSKLDVNQSNIVLVLTKWQNISEEDLEEYLALNGFQNYNYVMWENDIYKQDKLATKVSQVQFDKQLNQLLINIQKCQSYYLGIPSEIEKDIQDLYEQYLKDEELFKKHKVEIGIALSKTERFRSWIIGGWIGTTLGGSIWAGRLFYLVNIAVEGAALGGTLISGGLGAVFVGLGGVIVNKVTKPSQQECKHLAKGYIYFNIQKKAGVNDK